MRRAFSVVVIDADRFKAVNDRYGHAAGDSVLRHLADSLVAAFGAAHTIARIGGEEFVVLLSKTTPRAAERAAQALCRAVDSGRVSWNSHEIRYTVSAGVSAVDDDISSVDVLLQRADTALYVAKARGRNRVVAWESHLENRDPAFCGRS